MSLIGSRVNLVHACTTQRPATADPDTWGQAPAPNWEDNLTDVPCRVWTTSGRQAVDAATIVVVEDVRMVVPLGTDVTTTDRISSVTYRGDTILTGPVGIRAVITRKDHLELILVQLT